MTPKEKQKAIDALKISAPIKAVTQEEFNDYIQTINQIIDWLEQEPTTKNDLGVDSTPHFICSHDTNEEMEDIRNEIFSYDASFVEYTIEGHSDSDIEKIVENVINQFKDLVLDVVSNHITYETRTIANMENSKINRQEYKEPTSKNDLGVDCISREAVERIINKWLSRSDYELKDHIYSMTEKIHNLPSVTPIRPKGHWIVEKGGSYLGKRNGCCSNCKDFYTNDWNVMSFCPNCGADMREVEE